MSDRKRTAAISPNQHVVEVPCPAGTTREQLISDVAVDGVMANAATVLTFASCQIGDGDAMCAVESLRKSIRASQDGDFSVADTLLISQASALNAISHEMFRRAALNVGTHLEAMDLYMRIGLRAQSQCRATLESLARIKSPPSIAFVKQANIAHGHQQVNNSAPPSAYGAASCVEKREIAPNELLENVNDQWMDARATGTAGRGDTPVEAVGEVHGTADKRGKCARAK